LPIALNWSAVNRRTEPEASLPREFASELLASVPPRGVLFVAGDNDSYPLWYLQQVEHVRRDVTVVTMPLLGAPWMGRELERRDRLLGKDAQGDMLGLSAQVARAARASGRPVAVAVTVPAADRSRIGASWTVTRLVYLERQSSGQATYQQKLVSQVFSIDTLSNVSAAAAIELWKGGRSVHESLDPVHDYFISILDCPKLTLATPSKAQLASLDSLCNRR
jgi:hypothetical protein